MSDLELNKSQEERDTLDGGFAVVDRERLIEEETREITPWYKHFIHVFTAPEKMMEECFNQEPPKGASVGVVGTILFTVTYLLLISMNTEYKQVLFEQLRAQGLAESALDHTYKLSMVTGGIGGIIGVFISCLIGAIVLQVIKAIAKDKGKFGTIYKVMLLASMVGLAIQSIDAALGLVIGQYGTIFSLSTLLSPEQLANPVLTTLVSAASLQGIAQIIIMVIGYKVMAHVSYKKAIMILVIYEVLMVGSQIGITSMLMSITQGMMPA